MRSRSPIAVLHVMREIATHVRRAPGLHFGAALLCALPDLALELADGLICSSEVDHGSIVLRSPVSMAFAALYARPRRPSRFAGVSATASVDDAVRVFA